MSIRDRIIAELKGNPEGLDDDMLAKRLGLSHREQANSRCRALAQEGLVERRSIGGKLRNVLIGSGVAAALINDVEAAPTGSDKPWCWEGNVVRTVVSYLTDRGWTIEAIADTITGEPGADIRATRSDQILVVEVKGYPSKFYEWGPKAGQKKRTNPPTQARHWFGEALLTALLRQSNGDTTQVVIAFPEFDVYTKLFARIKQSIRQLGLMVLIVSESGRVDVVQDGSRIPRP
jgi:hypothetical protein